MSKIIYSTVQMKELESNKYVEKCTSKQIQFTDTFKIELLKLSDKGLFYREIFHKLGFPDYITHSKVPERTYTRYKNINGIFLWSYEGGNRYFGMSVFRRSKKIYE